MLKTAPILAPMTKQDHIALKAPAHAACLSALLLLSRL